MRQRDFFHPRLFIFASKTKKLKEKWEQENGLVVFWDS